MGDDDIAVLPIEDSMRAMGTLAIAVGLTLASCAKPPPSPPGATRADPFTAASEVDVNALGTAPVAASASAAPIPEDPAARAASLAQRFIIVDGHVDLPHRLRESRSPDGGVGEDISERTEKGDFDWVRAREGGLDAPFMSIYVPAKLEGRGAKKLADELIHMVETFPVRWPEKFALARTPADVRANSSAKKISLPMGLENGSPIEKKLENVKHFHDRGIRYITLTHSKDNHIADSSYDGRRTNRGLSPFGRKVVREMNRLGIMVDVSHLSDEAAAQSIEISEVPVIASHSSCRKFTPGWPRNMSDELIRALAAKGGVIQINFGSGFIDDGVRKQQDSERAKLREALSAEGLDQDDPAAKPVIEAFQKRHPTPRATVEQVVDHIVHVIDLVGVEHVGLGSDFDGVGDTLPDGLRDASAYPNLFRVLLARGVSEADLEKIASGNVFRVWDRVQAFAGAAK